MLRIDILTIFPEIFRSYFSQSIIGRAQRKGLIHLGVHNIRDFPPPPYHQVDDHPYGGGAGMVMKIEPIVATIEKLKTGESKTVLLSPQGRSLNHRLALELSRQKHLILVCGRYEGVDERVRENFIDEDISIGDYVLMGGELPALVLVETVTRLVPGVVGSDDSIKEDSFATDILDYPQYTRPQRFRQYEVPQVLVSGDHQEITRWRRQQALRRTLKCRPDLLKEARLNKEDLEFLRSIGYKK